MHRWRRKTLIACMTLIVTLPFTQVFAQKMYRCGNVYQDRPCDGAKPGKELTGAGSNRNSARPAPNSASGTHPECRQRGADSQKIVWAREAGTTQEKAMAEESDSERARLIANVYRVRGTVAEVRARIEAECIVEMEEEAKALALQRALDRARRPLRAQSAAPPQSAESGSSAQQKQQHEQSRAAAIAADKKEHCDQLNRLKDGNRAEQRTGGGIQRMEELAGEARSIAKDLQEAGC